MQGLQEHVLRGVLGRAHSGGNFAGLIRGNAYRIPICSTIPLKKIRHFAADVESNKSVTSPNRQSAVVEMSCVEVRRLMNDYLEGDLELEAYVRVDAHLEECDHCSALYKGVLNVVSLLGSGEVFPLPEGIEGRLLQRWNELFG